MRGIKGTGHDSHKDKETIVNKQKNPSVELREGMTNLRH